jgi:hypothetical protein
MDARSGSFFESQLDSYRNRIGQVKADQALAWAKKIAEAENPAEAAREAVAEIGTPLALDFLREGIMHYAGVASAQIKNKLANLDPKFKEIFKGRMDELARVAKMKPEERKKWLADEVKKRRQARLQRESEDKAPDTDTADSAREGAGGDREDELGVPRPADDSTEGRRDDAAGQGAGAVPEREPDRPAPRVSQEDVDDQGVNEQISRLRGLEPGEFNWAEEYDKIRGNIDSKAGALSRRRRDAMNKGTPDFKEPTSVDEMADELNARNKIVNDALARKGKKSAMATEYDVGGDALKVQGRRLKTKAPQSAREQQRDAQQQAVDTQSQRLERRNRILQQRRDLAGAQEPLPELSEPTLLDAFTGEPVRPKAPSPVPEEPDLEPADIPEPIETAGGAQPPREPSLASRLPPAPPSIASGETYVSQTQVNPFSFVQASEQASRANLGQIFKDGVEGLPTPDLTGASARIPEPKASANLLGRVNPDLPDIPGFTTPRPSVQERARALSSQLVPTDVLPQTATRAGLGKVPGLALDRPPKASVRPTRPGGLQSAEIGSEPREAPIVSEEAGARIGAGLGTVGAVTGILAPLANQNLTGAQKATAVGEGAGVLAGSELAARGASALGASAGLAESAGFVPGLIATFAGPGTLAQKAKAAGQQIGVGIGQKAIQKGAQALRGAPDPAGQQPTPKPSGADDAPGSGSGAGAEGAEGAAEGAEGGFEGLEGIEGALAASGAETGGLGFIAAGIVGLGAALASIFAPHAKPPPPPKPVIPNFSVPVSQLGIN